MLHLKTRILTAIVILTNVLGNFFLSWGLRGSVLGESVREYIGVLFNPWVSLGAGLLVLWMLSRMALLSWADLSYVLPVTALGYVLNAVMGKIFLGEQVSMTRWAGTLFIMGGMWLVASTSVRTTDPNRAGGVK